MSKFAIIIIALILGFGALIVAGKSSKPKEPTVGVQQKSQGAQHISRGESHAAYNSSPASSGPHYADAGAPTPWGVYTEEVPEETFLHNMEHGGVVITYNPKLLPADQLQKLRDLFMKPSKDFSPREFIITPRSSNTRAIQVVSWTWTMDLDSYDESMLKKFFKQHAGTSPEANAGPSNTPINQAAGQ